MALVNYSSESGEDPDGGPPPAKRRRCAVQAAETSGNPTGTDGPCSKLPPLPAAFHDLYASSVRQSVVDDPSLHHGRKRQTPHVVGNWPTHLYTEWHPTTSQHRLLTELTADVDALLKAEAKLTSSLTSDLGAPVPLHISLSRPISLATAQKEDFLDRVTTSLRNSRSSAFCVTPSGLAWYRSPESNRTFLILRITSSSATGADDEKDAPIPNPELMQLLVRCNALVAMFGQPPLYQQTHKDQVGHAFHVSIGWTLGLPGEETSLKALNLFRQPKYLEMRAWTIDVSGVKVKVGNVVTHVPLTAPTNPPAASSIGE